MLLSEWGVIARVCFSFPVQELPPGINIEEPDPAACSAGERLTRGREDSPLVQVGTSGKFLTGATRQNAAAKLEQEWEDQFLNYLKTMESPCSGWTSPQPSLECDTRTSQASLDGGARAGQWPHAGGVSQTLPGLSGLNCFEAVQEKILEWHNTGTKTPKQELAEVPGCLGDVALNSPAWKPPGSVKIQLSMKIKQENGGWMLGAVNPALESEKTFWLENPEQISSIGIWLERAEGTPFQGPEFKEIFGTQQGVQSPQDNNPGSMGQLAPPCEEKPNYVHEETSLRHGRKKKEKGKRRKKIGQDCEKSLPQSLPGNPIIPTEVKMYRCSYCVESFVDSSDLLTHERAHIREKVYICSQCEQRFPHHFELLAHKRSHH
ncbi:hypothetical protein lerEdw1_011389 [Lerista edwardsae]|nr:hypothetical protein lerEdw1_011389 [Lerista edwardsae]